MGHLLQMKMKIMKAHLVNSEAFNDHLSISLVRLLLLHLFSAGTAYVILSRLFPWLGFKLYLTWPIVVWKDFVIRWLIDDLEIVPSKVPVGAVALAAALILLSVAIAWGMKLKNKWSSNALILLSLYIQILITCMLSSL
jgi:hypothetical protein